MKNNQLKSFEDKYEDEKNNNFLLVARPIWLFLGTRKSR
ncbi:hypothetical protein A343_1524 [Porphyromonas gingivalis JCVI SC001]|nr:hypothetical protein A343_1524 [Porphyromonas gingivalis JCVI SC001]